jgi:RimJ/RimL family protein N-acetyltransferase
MAALPPALPLLANGDVRLEPLADAHAEALRAAAAEDPAIWEIYSYSLLGDGFDRWWGNAVSGRTGWRYWAILWRGRLVGCTGVWPEDRTPGVAEVGGTYLRPDARGTPVNRVAKWLVLGFLFDCGFHRVEFRIDDRNKRSQAAVEKLGARRDGILRHHKITHTGHVRDTHVFAILESEWPSMKEALRP